MSKEDLKVGEWIKVERDGRELWLQVTFVDGDNITARVDRPVPKESRALGEELHVRTSDVRAWHA